MDVVWEHHDDGRDSGVPQHSPDQKAVQKWIKEGKLGPIKAKSVCQPQ